MAQKLQRNVMALAAAGPLLDWQFPGMAALDRRAHEERRDDEVGHILVCRIRRCESGTTRC
jgi:hypothetical protein